MATRMQQRRGTAAQWISTNSGNGPILAAGEIGFESDTNKFKVGDGVNHWVDLDYFVDINSIENPSFGSSITFEGVTANSFETTLTVTDPTADRTLTLPDETGTIATRSYVDSSVSNAEVDQSTLAGTGLEWNVGSEQFDVDFDVVASKTYVDTDFAALAGAVFTGDVEATNLTVTGNLTVEGTTTTVDTANLSITDPMIYMGEGNTSNAVDLGFVAAFDNGTYQHTGLVRDASDNKWKLFRNVTDEPTTVINFTQASLDSLQLGALEAVELTVGDVSNTEIGYLNGVTSSIQAQLDNKQDVVANVSSTQIGYLEGASSNIQAQIDTKLSITSASETYQAIVSGVSDVEIAHLDGVTGPIQTQIDLKAPITSPTFAGTVTLPTGTVTSDMILDGTIVNDDISATAAIAATKISGTAVTQADTGTISTSMIADSAVTTDKIDDDAITSAKIAAGAIVNTDINASAAIEWTKIAPSSTVSATELSYLDGVTSAIQTQLDTKALGADLDSHAADTTSIHGISDTSQLAYLNAASQTFTGNMEVDGNMTVDGNLTVNGTTFSASATSITIEDNLVQLAHQNSANTVDLGIVVAYNDGTAKHSGIVRDVSDSKWKLFKDVTDEPATTVNFGQGSLDDLALNNLTAAGIVFTDGTQTKEGVPSRTPIISKTAAYTLSSLTERDSVIEVSHTGGTAVTISIPTDATLDFPIGTSIDIFQVNTGGVTIAASSPGTTAVNATPGLTLRTQWSTATLFKRAANTWIVYGDLKA